MKPKELELQIKKEMQDCIHFNGIQRDQCKAGVNIRALVGGCDLGWAVRIPCLGMDVANCIVTCDKRTFPTREEAMHSILEEEARFDKTLKVVKSAHQHAKDAGLGRGNGGRGEMSCPAECGGTLRYSVAGVNGHIHASCSTKGCVAWME